MNLGFLTFFSASVNTDTSGELSIFVQISLAIALAAVISLIMQWLKQPLIIGYILTGILVGPSVLNLINAQEAFHAFSEIGIALLLFIIGLGLNMTVIRSLGKVSFLTALLLLLIMGAIGLSASMLLGYNIMTSIIIGIALFFSSTIIILKSLSDKHEQNRLFGQLAIGVILVDDVIATVAMITVAMMASDTTDAWSIISLLLNAVGLGALLYISGKYIIPRIGKTLANSQELLFIFSIGWGLSIASLFDLAGLSAEIGALFAGISLAGLPYATAMATKLKPIRDFFIVLFFVTLGEHFTIDAIIQNFWPALLLSILVMLIKPVIITAILAQMKYTTLTSFKAAIHLSQISEFSIILITVAAGYNLIDEKSTPLITLVALITIALSTYLMNADDKLYEIFKKYLKLFEKKDIREKLQKNKNCPVMLFGYHNGGHEFVSTFREMKKKYLVVDYNPEIIEHLEAQGIRHAYGDVTDNEFLEEIGAAQAELIVSTIDILDINLSAMRYLRKHNLDISYICHASNYEDAETLYKEGASYVSIPHYIGSEKVSSFIKRKGHSHSALSTYRSRHLITIGKKAISMHKSS